jgi:hypothetical protein
MPSSCTASMAAAARADLGGISVSLGTRADVEAGETRSRRETVTICLR